MPESEPNFFVSGCSEWDMGQIAEILLEPMRTFAPRWRTKGASMEFSPRKHAGLIILGDDKYWATSSRYRRDREWMAKALRCGTPVLGICYGAQLLAASIGTRKINGRRLAIAQSEQHQGALVKIDVQGEGRTDPVVGHLADGTRLPQYHLDAFQEPSGATALAWSAQHSFRHCEAFRVGRPEAAIYGLQFHPEPTLEMLQATGGKDRWFKNMPRRASLDEAVEAGKRTLGAWFDLAIARHSKSSAPKS